MVINLYSKTNCPLCDKAKQVLQELQREFSFQINEIDIYQDDALLEKYQLMIPVVEIDGEEVDFGMVQKDVIRKRLLEAQSG
ncbi:glutaredoxin family protein [Parageobacillus sp. G301]|uniref:glutaredoxin family protein n=1 Tax=Parageobacillus sp. G301 TaxID=2998290 RepID=UPI0024976688|nr:glutaredoxin family protein [Parageobacillus sp. G301]GLH64358.1 thioredoxin family protein [Parageobacillus sp. G301]